MLVHAERTCDPQPVLEVLDRFSWLPRPCAPRRCASTVIRVLARITRQSGHIHAEDVRDWFLTAGFDEAEVAIKTKPSGTTLLKPASLDRTSLRSRRGSVYPPKRANRVRAIVTCQQARPGSAGRPKSPSSPEQYAAMLLCALAVAKLRSDCLNCFPLRHCPRILGQDLLSPTNPCVRAMKPSAGTKAGAPCWSRTGREAGALPAKAPIRAYDRCLVQVERTGEDQRQSGHIVLV